MGLLKTLSMRASTIGLAAAALLIAVSLASSPARAESDEDRAKARELADQGKAALQRKDFAAAADLFRRAGALVSAPTLELGRARAEVGLGHLAAARDIYANITEKQLDPASPPAFFKAVSDAVEELAVLELRLPRVVVIVHGPPPTEVEVTIDGAPLSKEDGARHFVDPGKHLARASAPDFRAEEASFTASEGVVSKVQLDLSPDPIGPRQRPTTVGFALIGLGVGALAAGGAVGAFALRDRGELYGRCPDGHCSELDREKIDSYHRFTKLAWPALAVGAASAGVGTALYLSSDREGAALPTKLGPGLLGAGVAGLAFGAVSGIVTLGLRPDSAVSCPEGVCPQDLQDRLDSYHALGLLSIVALATGGSAALAGGLLILLPKDKPASAPAPSARRRRAPEVTFAPTIGPGFIGVSGRF